MARGKADRRKTAKVNLRLVQLPLGARLVNVRNPADNWAQLVIFDERADLVEARREQAEALARLALKKVGNFANFPEFEIKKTNLCRKLTRQHGRAVVA